MRLFLIILISFLGFLFIDCNSNTNLKGFSFEKPSVHLKLKDTVSYKTIKYTISNFILSPLEDDKLWVFTGADSYELNLKDSSWTNLESRFGKYSKLLRAEDIFSDTQNNDLLWLGNSIAGLIIYDINSGLFMEYPDIKPVTGICFTNEEVFVGTKNGVYQYSRITQEIKRVAEIPEIEIDDIVSINDSSLQINNKYQYNYLTNKLSVKYLDKLKLIKTRKINNFEISIFQDNTITIRNKDVVNIYYYTFYMFDCLLVDENYIWMPQQNLSQGIMLYSGADDSLTYLPVGYQFTNYQVINDDPGIWFYSSNTLLYFNKNDHSTRVINFDLTKQIRNVMADKEFILAHNDKYIKIYNKDYLIEHSVRVDLVKDEIEKFNKYRDQFYAVQEDYIQEYKIYKSMLAGFSTSTNPLIKEQLREFKYLILYRTPYKIEDVRYIIDNQLDMIEEDDIRAALYIKLVTLYNYEAKLKESLLTDSILIRDYPQCRDEHYRKNMERVVRSEVAIDSILSGSGNEEERLWRLGKAYYELFYYVGPISEASYVIMEYPFQYFHELLEKYPDSQYADDAEFIMLLHNESGSHEGGDNSYNLKAIDEYKSILDKYPGTEWTPNIYLQIGSLYTYCEAEYPERRGYYGLAIDYLRKIKDEYPDFEKMKEVNSLLQEIDYELPRFLWEFQIESDKKEYSPDEPIIITFRIKNLSEEAKKYTINAGKDVPNFLIRMARYPRGEYYSGEGVSIEQDIKPYSLDKKDTIIYPGSFYEEKWNIKENAREEERKAPGYFKMDKPAAYRIDAYTTDNNDLYIPSNTIWIKVIKKD